MKSTKLWLCALAFSAFFALGLGFISTVNAENLSGVYLYFADYLNSQIHVIDANTNSEVATISTGVGSVPLMTALAPDQKTLYVSDAVAAKIYVIDTTTNTLATSFSIGAIGEDIAISPSGDKLYNLDRNTRNIYVIDLNTHQETKTISIGQTIWLMDITQDGSRIYITNNGAGGKVFEVDMNTESFTKTYDPDSGMGTGAGLKASPDGTKVALCDPIGRGAYLLNVSSGSSAKSSGYDAGGIGGPIDVAFNPAGTKAYFAHSSFGIGGNQVKVVDVSSAANTNSITVGGGPSAVVFSPNGERAYVANYTDRTISVINANSEASIATITPSGMPMINGLQLVDRGDFTGSLEFNGGKQYTTSADVTLNLGASGDTNLSRMMISNNADFADANWETYSAAKTWTLASGYGSKTVYVKLMNESGRVTDVVAGQITLEKPMIVTAPRQGGGPQVRVFDWANNKVTATKVSFMAYASSFRGGVNIAYGDVNDDGRFEIVTAPGATGGPQVKVWDRNGKLLSQFMAYPSAFRGGVKVAVGDLDGNGTDEIITGPQSIGTPQVRVFDSAGNTKFTAGFFAYDKSFKGGVSVAAGDVNRDGQDEIITGAGLTGAPQVRVFSRYGKSVSTPGFFAYDSKFRGGVTVSTGDLNADGKWEILTAPGNGGGANVRVFNSAGKPSVSGGYNAWKSNEAGARGGVSITSTDYSGDGKAEVVGGAGIGSSPMLRFFDVMGNTKPGSGFMTYAQSFKNGINVASHSL